jgi:hypothetical protein
MSESSAISRSKSLRWWSTEYLRGPILDPRRRFLTAILAICLGVGPMALFNEDSRVYVGISPAVPTIYTYTAVLLGIAIIYTATDPRRDWQGLKLWIPLLGWLLIMTLLAWGFSLRMTSGMLHLALGAVVFAVGVSTARRDPDGYVLPWAFAATAWIQLLSIGLAAVGLPLRHIKAPQAPDLVGRAYGLTSHPGELAKILFFCAMFALVLPRRTPVETWFARLTLGATLAGISLSQSRSGLVSVLVLLVGFVGLEAVSSGLRRSHYLMIGAAGVLGLASTPWLIARFSADPTGGARQHLLSVASVIIRDHWWAGLGPNNYVALGGAYDYLVSTGVPVHNAILLSAAELGVVGAMALWLPFITVIVLAVAAVRRTKGHDAAGRIIIAALPGLILLAVTGWGLLQAPSYLILALAFGYLGALTGRRPVSTDAPQGWSPL